MLKTWFKQPPIEYRAPLLDAPIQLGSNHISFNWVLNEADTLESSSILIYSKSWASLYTEMVGVKPH
jgi:hypothetical protein